MEGSRKGGENGHQDLCGVLLITANLGSLFEDLDNMLPIWLKAFFEVLQRLQPGFVAIHCQEVGGKNFETGMNLVDNFVEKLFASEEMSCYRRSHVVMDKDYQATDDFTALGNIYFVHDSIASPKYYDFKSRDFRECRGHMRFMDNLSKSTCHEKMKFPKDLFPESRFSRKGFLRTRWCINGSVFDLINLHLFHDASNVVAMQSFPSTYSNKRKKALHAVLERLETDEHETVPYFVFGDFNFRLDTHDVVKALTASASGEYTKENNDIVKVVFTENGNSGKVVLTLEKKKFEATEISPNKAKWLLQFDKEAASFSDHFLEFDKDFAPSYPYSEDVNEGGHYMQTRVPSWCDRVFFSKSANGSLITNPDNKGEYQVIGADVCMGDHKPVYLHFSLVNAKDLENQDIVWRKFNNLSPIFKETAV
ncbi:inositol polyphosphate-5-phosphatase A-like isoform X2 [Anneissia japonica]|uniref:inositol polyphosphate-5-phosphatase A-like isoform X2 n=1 Tax=Anneissia japonica TaxID=1529436 RepID=UPI0014258AD8|nr:inositol polyphosphate-5-phosphatase A-like isoform X2 [Anneissia japonica]